VVVVVVVAIVHMTAVTGSNEVGVNEASSGTTR